MPSEATRDSDWFKFTTKRQADIIAWEEIEKGEDIATDVSDFDHTAYQGLCLKIQ